MGGIAKRFEDILCSSSLIQTVTRLTEVGVADEIWRSGTTVGELLLVHFVRFEDPLVWAKLNDGNLSTYVDAIIRLRESIACFPKICKLIESLWSARPDIARHIGAATMQALAEEMAAVHPKFVAGCSKYLNCKLLQGWDFQLDQTAACNRAHSAIAMYIGAVTNLYLDAGHWHELWAAGKDVAICLIEHFLLHENQTGGKWTAEHVRNPEKYLNRNLQNIRDVVYANRHVVDVLSALRSVRSDIALFLDGKALYRIASKLRTADILLDFMAFTLHSLPEGWLDSSAIPQSEIHTCIDIYISNGWHISGQAMQSIHARVAPAHLSCHPLHSPATSSTASPRRAPLSCSPTSNASSPTYSTLHLNPNTSTFSTLQPNVPPLNDCSATAWSREEDLYTSFGQMSVTANSSMYTGAHLGAAAPAPSTFLPSPWSFDIRRHR